MQAFKDGLVLTGAFNEFEDLASATAEWNLTYTQLSSGSFTGSMDICSTAQIQIVRQTWSAPLLVAGDQPGGAVAIALPVNARQGIKWLGTDYDHERTIVGGAPGHEVQLLTSSPLEIVALSIENGLFERHLRTRFGIEGSMLGRDLSLRVRPGTPGCTERGRAVEALRGVLASGAATSQAARQHLQEAVLQIALEGLDFGASGKPASMSVRRRAARAADEVLRARLDDPPSLGELCHLTRIGERTLHAAFQETFGLPPKRYLRALRLNAARRRLRRCEGNVTEVAADLGFFHFARFALEYRNLFHELPSDTLRRARLQGGLAVAGQARR